MKIVSGGQTGVDRAALDAAIELGIDHGGWVPKGRMSIGGPIPDRYNMREMSTVDYPSRTRQNIIDRTLFQGILDFKLKRKEIFN